MASARLSMASARPGCGLACGLNCNVFSDGRHPSDGVDAIWLPTTLSTCRFSSPPEQSSRVNSSSKLSSTDSETSAQSRPSAGGSFLSRLWSRLISTRQTILHTASGTDASAEKFTVRYISSVQLSCPDASAGRPRQSGPRCRALLSSSLPRSVTLPRSRSEAYEDGSSAPAPSSESSRRLSVASLPMSSGRWSSPEHTISRTPVRSCGRTVRSSGGRAGSSPARWRLSSHALKDLTLRDASMSASPSARLLSSPAVSVASPSRQRSGSSRIAPTASSASRLSASQR
mmetsp:Transcript_10091/g.25383  ORF Transcript_10091/g.25383 Transcript_10091/m.25383 type:complete len:287 (+) Transcript_10091:155-1015(+)